MNHQKKKKKVNTKPRSSVFSLRLSLTGMCIATPGSKGLLHVTQGQDQQRWDHSGQSNLCLFFYGSIGQLRLPYDCVA